MDNSIKVTKPKSSTDVAMEMLMDMLKHKEENKLFMNEENIFDDIDNDIDE